VAQCPKNARAKEKKEKKLQLEKRKRRRRRKRGRFGLLYRSDSFLEYLSWKSQRNYSQE